MKKFQPVLYKNSGGKVFENTIDIFCEIYVTKNPKISKKCKISGNGQSAIITDKITSLLTLFESASETTTNSIRS